MPRKKYDFDAALQQIIAGVGEYYPKFGASHAEKITRAFHYAQEAHKIQKRYSGEPYFVHPVEAVFILLKIKPDISTVITCLLHDVIEDTPRTADEIEAEFGVEIRHLCEGVEKVSKVNLAANQKNQRHFWNLQKLFVAMAKDIRVIFVKLADRIQNLSTLHFVPEHKQKRIARESLNVYAKVADKLGIYDFKTLIEDYCLQYLEPATCAKISAEIRLLKANRQSFIEKAEKEITKTLHASQIKVLRVEGRRKGLYSTFEKMKRKNLTSVSEIYDLFGLRVIVEKRNECYLALGLLHEKWKSMPNRFKDYISVSKSNGYQSLHTTLLGLCGSAIPTEVQIKTEKMHSDAEFGPAAHWAYKEKKDSDFDETYLERTRWMPKSVNLHREKSPKLFFEEMSKSILGNRIYVFTPDGDVKNLVNNATPVDFAYSVHSEIGNGCIGAKVNGIIKPLDYVLKNNDIVEIIFKKGGTPNPHWLKFAQSTNARNHIKMFIKKYEIEGYKTPTPERKASVSSLSKSVLSKKQKDEPKVAEILIGEKENIPFQLAPCCSPAPGKSIVGYNTRGTKVTIHESGCKTLQKLNPSRLVDARFVFKREFNVWADDRRGLMSDYSSTISRKGIFIWDIHFRRQKDNRVRWNFTLDCSSESEFQELLNDFNKIPNVTSIEVLR